jgi:hypothetical protein
MSELNYNYVFFNVGEGNARRKDPNGYNTICVKDLEEMAGVRVVSYPLDYAPYCMRWLFSAHHTPKVNRIINLPGKKLWYPHYFKNDFIDKKPLCFVFSGSGIATKIPYLRYLKRKYPDCNTVLLRRDMMWLWEKNSPEFTEEITRELFDLRMSYDKKEAEQYDMIYFSEFESAIDIQPSAEDPACDVFFAGKAKDRLDKLMAVYRKLTAAGLTCHYYLTGVPENKRISLPGVEYADKSMSYRQMLQRSVEARCLLEINQGGAVGYTSRFLESVIYGKRLLTNNVTVADTKFYDPRYIQCFIEPEDIDVSFIKADIGKIDYGYHEEFSPCRLIEQIDRELSKKNG